MGCKVEVINTEVLRSRLLLILLQYLGNILIPDHNAQVFQFTKTVQDYGILDKIIFHLFGGFLRWDAHYFVHISIYGYTYENTLAFFPLLPGFIGSLSRIVYSVFPFISIESIVLLLYLTFNIIVFRLTTIQLYKLTSLIFNEKFAYKVAILFCYNPASIFFIAPYTECLFCYLTFRVILSCFVLYKSHEKDTRKFKISDGKVIIETGLSTLVRSNGIINIGFIVFAFMCLMRKAFPRNGSSKCQHIFKYLCLIFVYSILSIAPFLLYQLYCYSKFCLDFHHKLPKNVEQYGKSQSYVLPGEFSKHKQSWCNKHLPLAYSYVQEHYWNVGLMRYYELKQIPNFLLAAPIIIIILRNCVVHLYRNFNQNNIFSIFVLHTIVVCKKSEKTNVLHPVLNVFVVHALVLTVFCILVIHIQVSTRLLCSASPILYWYCGQYMSDNSCKTHNFKNFLCSYNSYPELCVKIYFFSYFILGTVLFCNFLPWT